MYYKNWWKDEVKKMNQCPQRQDSTRDQMIDLYGVAVKLGFYGAADYIRSTFEDQEGSKTFKGFFNYRQD